VEGGGIEPPLTAKSYLLIAPFISLYLPFVLMFLCLDLIVSYSFENQRASRMAGVL
jgi:hypothetical protein